MSAAPKTATYAQTFRGERLAAAAMWDRMLAHVPTQLGKLVSVASFRDGSTGEYGHPTLDRVLSAAVARRVLRESHEHLFAEWVGLFPDEQAADVKRYLAALPQKNARTLLRRALENLIPGSASLVARRAFLSDLQAVLAEEAEEAPAASVPEFTFAMESVA